MDRVVAVRGAGPRTRHPRHADQGRHVRPRPERAERRVSTMGRSLLHRVPTSWSRRVNLLHILTRAQRKPPATRIIISFALQQHIRYIRPP